MTEEVTTPVEPQTPVYTATFTTKINAIRTATVNGLENTVKQVDWTMVGEEAGLTFELPQTIDLADPESANFVPLASLTETAVIAWVEATVANVDAVKAHIQFVLDKEVAKAALASTAMPWAPVVTPTP